MKVARTLSVLLALSLTAADASAQTEIFERGNQLYQEGDFAGAVAAYEAVLQGGFESADLYYNLGNAHFKAGALGPSILSWERALSLAPGDADVEANLELARSLTADAIEPLPTFWLFTVGSWWLHLLPRSVLIGLVTAAWLATCGGTIVWILRRSGAVGWIAAGGLAVVLVFGSTLAVRELELAQPERGVILAEAVSVRSAPADDDNLTLFEVHEGTRVRVDQRAGDWVEVVLDDGKVGWVRADVMDVI